nr:NADH dehydrogenase subunit 1 [Syrista sp. 1 GYN-2021c]
MSSFWISVLSFILTIISVLIGVAFLTLYERKFLGYVQLRKGPNKLGILGIMQPFSDAVKLFTKEYLLSFNFNYLIFLFSPIFMMILSLFIWVLLPFMTNMWSNSLGILFMLSVMGVSVYSVMYAGWSSNSIFSLLGSMRSVAQTISYEVSLALIFLLLALMGDSFDFYDLMVFQLDLSMLYYLFPLFGLFFISSVAELNRAPFDFVEGESELVSGFNVEYASGMFALLFLSEYSMILFFSMLITIMFGGLMWFNFLSYLFIMSMFSGVVLIRGAYPRFRYDKLMGLVWSSILPFVLFYLVFILSIKFSFLCFIL